MSMRMKAARAVLTNEVVDIAANSTITKELLSQDEIIIDIFFDSLVFRHPL